MIQIINEHIITISLECHRAKSDIEQGENLKSRRNLPSAFGFICQRISSCAKIISYTFTIRLAIFVFSPYIFASNGPVFQNFWVFL